MSSTIAIDFILPWTQTTATSLQTVFDGTWTADDADDVIVYARATGVAADDATQLISSADYTVTFVGTDEDVRVTFSVGRTLNDIVTLTRKTPTSRLNLYSNTNFTPTMLNGDFNKLVMMLQERVLENLILPDAASASTRLSPKYNNSESLTYPNDAILPILTAGGIWRKNDANTAFAQATIPTFPVGSDADFTNDNRIVKTDTSGTYNNVQETGMTVDDSDNITGINNITVNSVQFPTNSPVSGQVIAATSATTSAWSNAGDGDVDGPASATDNAVCRFDSTTGKLIQDSSVIIDDSDNMTGAASININSTIAIVGTIDDDTMATATATNVATSESIKAYVDASPAGDVVGPGSATDNAAVRWDGATGALVADSGIIISDVDGISGITELAVDNLNLNGNALTSGAGVISITPLSGQDLNITVDSGGEVNLTGAMHFTHTATENDDHALEIDCDAAGFGDVKAIDVNYDSGAIVAGEDEAIILVNINEADSTGGDIAALEVLATNEGSASIYALETFVNVNPVLQSSGTFGDMDSALNIAVDVLAALISGGAGNISVFVADNDTVTIGDAAKFEEMEIILGTGASGAGIAPTFEYSTGAGTWATFSPIDGTNGFRNTGAIAWLVGDIPGWMVDGTPEFAIRITRTRNTLSTTPILDEVQIAATTEYEWDASGDLTIGSIDIDASNAYSVAGTAILSDSAGTMTLSNIDLLDVTTALTIDVATYAADAAGSDTYAITLAPAPAAYYNGMSIKAKIQTANTGAATMNVNGLGAIAINKLHDQALATGDIEANQIIDLVYNSTGPKFQMQNQVATTPSDGKVLQVVNVMDAAVASGATNIPLDDTIPQNTEGFEVMTLAITPADTSNLLRIDVVVNGSVATTASFVAALFQDSTAGALGAAAMYQSTTTQANMIIFTHYMTAGTVSSTTFKVRIGSNGGAVTTTFNGISGARSFGGVISSSITITEIQA